MAKAELDYFILPNGLKPNPIDFGEIWKMKDIKILIDTIFIIVSAFEFPLAFGMFQLFKLPPALAGGKKNDSIFKWL